MNAVQCLVLLTQYRQGTQKGDETWMLLGKAVRLALQLGLHSSTAFAHLSSLEQEVRKRTWWMCVLLDGYVTQQSY